VGGKLTNRPEPDDPESSDSGADPAAGLVSDRCLAIRTGK
jgi:hypothetical protein